MNKGPAAFATGPMSYLTPFIPPHKSKVNRLAQAAGRLRSKSNAVAFGNEDALQ